MPHEPFNIAGQVTISLRAITKPNEPWMVVWQDHNIIPRPGQSAWLGWLLGYSVSRPGWIGLGTGAVSATSIHASALQAEVIRKTGSYAQVVNSVSARFICKFTPTQANYRLQEIGLFNVSGTTANMFAIASIDVTKTSAYAMQIMWSLAVLTGSALPTA